MHAAATSSSAAPSATRASAVSALFAYECEQDGPRVAIPRPEVQLVVRFGAVARDGLDIYVVGVGQKVHRKNLRRGDRALMARLRLGASQAVLAGAASVVAGRIVALEGLWGSRAARHLHERLAAARDAVECATILQRAIVERVAVAPPPSPNLRIALDAAERLNRANVNVVAEELGVSERHLRRIFREVVGVSPKAFAMLTRFQRALDAARAAPRASWATIAAAAGYYDQAHLIADFRTMSDVTPRALLEEMRGHAWLG